MKSFLSSVLLFTVLIISNGGKISAQSWLWGKAFGGLDGEECYSNIIDPENGDVYTTGDFNGTVDFDPGPGVFNLTSSGGYDIFISKLDGDGNFVWAKAILGASGHSITLDGIGNVYTTGKFSGTVDFDPGGGTYNLSSPQYYYFCEYWDEYCGCYYDCSYYGNAVTQFILKLNGSGNFAWAKAIGGSENSYSEGFSIAIDPSENGDIYTTGYFTGTVDFDPDTTEIFNLTSAGGPDIFISKWNGTGVFEWTKAMGGSGYDYGYSIAIDPAENGGVYTGGYFSGTSDFNPDSTINFNLTSVGGYDVFVSKLDEDGNFEWAKGIGGQYADYTYSLALDLAGSGDVYTTGSFQQTVDFDPGPGVFNLTSNGYDDIFISKLNSVGTFQWAKTIGGPSSESANAIALDPSGSGNVYTTGAFNGSVDFDPDSSGTFDLSSNGSSDIFISKLDAAGNFLWAKSAGGDNYDLGRAISVDILGNSVVAGIFYSPFVEVDSTTLMNHEQTCYDDYGNSFPCYYSDIILLKLEANAPPCATVVTNKNDSGSGSLRDIIYCALDGSTITFDSTLFNQTITLTSGEIIINKNLTLSGLGVTHLTITGKTARIFQLLQGKNLEIENMSLKYANGGANGGALFVKGHLTLENVLLQENSENGIPKSMTVTNTAVVDIIGNVSIKY